MVIRREVFVKEQSVPLEIEMDDYDETAIHILAFLSDMPVGTARWRETDQGIKLERFAVPGPFRGKGIGKSLLMFALDRVKEAKQVYLYAQLNVVPFYEKYGFTCVGHDFYEAGILHKKMVYLCDRIRIEKNDS